MCFYGRRYGNDSNAYRLSTSSNSNDETTSLWVSFVSLFLIYLPPPPLPLLLDIYYLSWTPVTPPPTNQRMWYESGFTCLFQSLRFETNCSPKILHLFHLFPAQLFCFLKQKNYCETAILTVDQKSNSFSPKLTHLYRSRAVLHGRKFWFWTLWRQWGLHSSCTKINKIPSKKQYFNTLLVILITSME